MLPSLSARLPWARARARLPRFRAPERHCRGATAQSGWRSRAASAPHRAFRTRWERDLGGVSKRRAIVDDLVKCGSGLRLEIPQYAAEWFEAEQLIDDGGPKQIAGMRAAGQSPFPRGAPPGTLRMRLPSTFSAQRPSVCESSAASDAASCRCYLTSRPVTGSSACSRSPPQTTHVSSLRCGSGWSAIQVATRA